MEMKPENIPDELLIQAKIVCAQLLIQTNTPDIVQEILDIYMIGLDIWTMQAGEYKLLIQLDMEELSLEKLWQPSGILNKKVTFLHNWGNGLTPI